MDCGATVKPLESVPLVQVEVCRGFQLHFKTWHQIAPGNTNLLKVISCLLSFQSAYWQVKSLYLKGRGGGGGFRSFTLEKIISS